MVDFKDKFEVPQQMREIAESSVGQARKAFDEFIDATHKAVVDVEESTSTVQTGASEVNKKALTFAEENVTAAFDLAQKMVKAKNVQDVIKIQQDFLQRQMETLGEQSREMNESIAKFGQDSLKK